jgi:hypothetical protein
MENIVEQQRLEIERLKAELAAARLGRRFEYKIATITPPELLCCGLLYCGFERERQDNVNEKTNVGRFGKFFGVHHSTLAPLFVDIINKYPGVSVKNLLMTMNWFTLYDVYEVLAGRWGNCEDYIGPKVKECGKMYQSFFKEKIKLRFHLMDRRRVIVGSLDTCTFVCQEFRLDPSSEWYDPKSHSSGLVSQM